MRDGTHRLAKRALVTELKPSSNGDAYGVSTVDRAIDLLDAFSHRTPELSLKEVAAVAGLHKATAFRLVTTLCRRGLLSKHPVTGLYRLGFRLISLAEIAKARTGLVAEALPIMRRVRDQLNETVVLAVRMGDQRIDVEQVEGLQNIRRVLTLGEPKSLYAGAAGKVLLAAMTDAEIEEYLGRTKLIAFTLTTPITAKAVWAEVAGIRRRGYAEGWDERNSGGAGAAAPIHGPAGDAIGSFSVAVPTMRYTPALKKLTIAAVVDAAAAISRCLGAPKRTIANGGGDK
jgi:DNA-binding IclR family transcriptional regulator